jgi:hypothetical protein
MELFGYEHRAFVYDHPDSSGKTIPPWVDIARVAVFGEVFMELVEIFCGYLDKGRFSRTVKTIP